MRRQRGVRRVNEAQLTEWRRRQEEKSAEQRRFRTLDEIAAQSQVSARIRAAVRKPKPTPRAKPAPQAKPKSTRVVHQACTGCGAPFARGDQPGTRHVGYGLCWKCAHPDREFERTLRPDCCNQCGRKVRAQSVPLSDEPDTVVYGAGGACSTCYARLRGFRVNKGERRRRTNANCLDCDRPLWSAGQAAPRAPGAVQHGGKGQCQGCRKRSPR